jgi:XTP/dITP diphosphohydrolase
VTVRCATTNSGKLREFRLAGELASVQVEPLPGIQSIPAPDETGTTFEENAIQKALYYGAHTSDWLFVDDSGLEVDALGGAPGVYSARFAGPDATDEANNSLLMERLAGVSDRGAQFVCVIALGRGGQNLQTFRGIVRGQIVQAPRGPNGFGYDPLFFYEPFGCTFGEAAAADKMRVSHRAQALKRMFTWLGSNDARSENR